MCARLTKMKEQKDLKWLNDINRVALNNSIVDLDRAFTNFFRKKAEYPRFKNKHRRQSFRLTNQRFSVKERGIETAMMGILKCSLNLPEKHKLLSMTVSKEPTDKYFVAISFETDIPDPNPNKKPIIGIDFGLKMFITTSKGKKIEHTQPFKQEEKRLKRIDRKLSRQKKGSNRRRVTRKKRALLYEKIRNRRSDFLHKLSRQMVSENQAIYLEDLNLKGMQQRWGKKVGDLGWYEFSRQLEYKGRWYGCEIKKIDRFFPSTKMCSKCNHINDNLTLKDREWTCPSCNTHHDRDVNAAKNILAYGRADRNVVERPKRTGRVSAVRPLREPSNQE
jgi:putative transposase